MGGGEDRAGPDMSQTPDTAELHQSMDKMASVQQNREMSHENLKHDRAPANQPGIRTVLSWLTTGIHTHDRQEEETC